MSSFSVNCRPAFTSPSHAESWLFCTSHIHSNDAGRRPPFTPMPIMYFATSFASGISSRMSLSEVSWDARTSTSNSRVPSNSMSACVFTDSGPEIRPTPS